MKKKLSRVLAVALPALLLGACGGSSSSTSGSSNQNGTVNLMLSDASTEDWSLIGVKVLTIALVPQNGGAPVTIFTAPSPPPTINLVHLDQLGELLGNVTVPAGTYTKAVVTVAANPGDVALTVSADPEPGFAGTPGASIPSSQIQIQGASGSAGNLTVPVTVRLESPLIVTASASNALAIEFDLGHPAFIVEHVPAGGGTPVWAVNFDGPLHHHPLRHLAQFVLRHLYGSVTAVSSDKTSLTMTKVYPDHPARNPETATASSQGLTVLADAANGTIFFDVDAKTRAVIHDFSSVSLNGKYVRVAARYQDDGTLVAVRIWAGSAFNAVWVSPEGHVLHVGATTLTVENEDATPVNLTVGASTEFYFRAPLDALADATAIGTGPAFLANLHRGFKVHASVVDPLANPLVAQTVDIEIAKFDGSISSPSTTTFTYTRKFATASDSYTATLHYLSPDSPNGEDASGNAVKGFKWWNFTFPTLADTGASAVSDFVAATGGTVSFGGTVAPLAPWGESYARWNDPANPGGWAASFAILVPTPLPRGTVATPWAASSSGGSFGMKVSGGTNTVPVVVSSVAGSATLVYQVDRTATAVTVSAEDLTTASGLAALSSHLTSGTPVKAYGVPQPDGSIKAYVLFYYTGIMP